MKNTDDVIKDLLDLLSHLDVNDFQVSDPFDLFLFLENIVRELSTLTTIGVTVFRIKYMSLSV